MMQPGVNKKLVIIDPALMTPSGHHAGLATFIAATAGADAAAFSAIHYICHKEVDANIRTTLEQAGIKVIPLFSINFYHCFGQIVRIPDVQEYLQAAIHEYRAAINLGAEDNLGVEDSLSGKDDAEQILYFHPTLNWDHAFILSLVFRQQPPPANVTHKCCAMFNPGMEHRGWTIDRVQELNHRIAFRPLSRYPHVEIFVSDSELANKYQWLLETDTPFPLFPSYLADWPSLVGRACPPINTKPALTVSDADHAGESRVGTAHHSELAVTLYLGDAKINKGFCRLPALARKILQTDDPKLNLYVQYTHCWPDSEIETAIDELTAISAADPRLVIDTTYLSDAALHERLRNTDVFMFLYDEKDYGEKSSGILHLVAWYGLNTIFLTNTWLNREAKRLGLPMLELKEDDFSTAPITDWLDRFTNATPAEINTQYWQQIYAPFWPWLT